MMFQNDQNENIDNIRVAEENVNNQNSHRLLVKVLKWYDNFQKLAVSTMWYINLPYEWAIPSNRCLLSRNKNICSQKYFYKDVHTHKKRMFTVTLLKVIIDPGTLVVQ